MRRYLTALLITVTLVEPALAGATTPRQHPNFTGTWTLNRHLSDPIQPPRPAGSQQSPGGGSKRGGGGRDGGGRHGGSGHGRGGEQQSSTQAQQRAARLQQELSHLEIFHDGNELDVTNGLDISRLLFTDGRTMTIWTQRGEATATAVWEGQTLVVQWKTRQDKVARSRRYTLEADGQRLTISEKRRLPQGQDFHEIILIYDKSD